MDGALHEAQAPYISPLGEGVWEKHITLLRLNDLSAVFHWFVHAPRMQKSCIQVRKKEVTRLLFFPINRVYFPLDLLISVIQNSAFVLIRMNSAPYWIIVTQSKVKTTPGSCIHREARTLHSISVTILRAADLTDFRTCVR